MFNDKNVQELITVVGDTIRSIKDKSWEYIHSVYQANADRYVVESSQPVACEAGCFYCCHLSVDTGHGEMDYILDRYRKERGESRYKEIVAKAEAKYQKTKDLSEDERINHRIACPFLQGTLCSIYEYRPIQCRGMIVAEKQPCIKAFHGDPDTDTPFHSKPKVLLGIFAIALLAIRNKLDATRAFFMAMKEPKTDAWKTMEENIVEYETKRKNGKHS